MDDRDLNYPSANNHSREILPNKQKVINQQHKPITIIITLIMMAHMKTRIRETAKVLLLLMVAMVSSTTVTPFNTIGALNDPGYTCGSGPTDGCEVESHVD